MTPSTVGDIMTRNVLTLNSEQSLLDALVFLREHEIRHVPVLDDGELVGILTDRDVKRATPSVLLTTDRESWQKTVSGTTVAVVMSRNPVSVPSDAPLKATLGLMIDKKFGCLPVVDAGKLTGIVTAIDLMKAMFQMLD